MSENPFRDQPFMQTRCPNVFFLLQTNPVTNPFDKAALSEEQKSVVVLTTVAELLKSSELTCVGRYVSPELPHQVCVFVVLLLT